MILTGWILTAFFSFVPNWGLAKMGTGRLGDKGRAFSSNFFSQPSNFSFLFLPCLLPAVYCLLPLSNRSLPEAILSLNRAYLSLIKAILSLNKAYLSLNQAILSLPKPQSLSIHRKFALYLAVNRS